MKKQESQTIPVCITIKTQENQNIERNIGIDLICVIDVSGSMYGQKILDVRDSLSILLNLLSEKDRLCIISFNSKGKRITPLKIVNESNKQYFNNNVIPFLMCEGGTNIAAGTSLAFNEFRKRKYRNQVSSIFLLTDGQDQNAINAFKSQHNQCNSIYQLSTFGFGDDHDANLMSELCSIGKGAFYYVRNTSLLHQYFGNALGGLVSVVGEKLEIDIVCKPQQPYEQIKISKFYGDLCMVQQVERQYQICIPYVQSGSQKDFVFELQIPKFDYNVNDNSRYAIIVEVQAKLNRINNEKEIIKKCYLPLSFLYEDEQIPMEVEYIDVSIQHMRVKVIEIIDEARKACENKEFELAQNMLKQVKLQIDSNAELRERAEMIYQDIDQVLKGCYAQKFNSFGQKLMIQMKVNNSQQQGLNAWFDEKGIQQEQIEDSSIFLNDTQKKYILKAKLYKK